jgi:mRNA-degrading endonuclease toxin of MazEF toxin-antitoxin module
MAMIRNFLEYSNETRFTDSPEINEENKIMILATPTPLTTSTKKLQFNLENKTGENIQGVILYKQCVRTVNL